MKISYRELIRSVIESAIYKIAVKEKDYFRTEYGGTGPSGGILYSKCYSAGAYFYVCKYDFNIKNQILNLTEVIYGGPQGWRYSDKVEFNLHDPDLEVKIGKHIRAIFDRTQTWRGN